MAHSHGHQRTSQQRSTAFALLLLLFGMLGGPFASGQQPSHKPSCCMDAQHCSLHGHRAAMGRDDAPRMAALTPQCPCTPLVPASSAPHGVPLLRAALLGNTLQAHGHRDLCTASFPQEAQGRADTTRGPPLQQTSAPVSA